jgi:proteasome accessory factor B
VSGRRSIGGREGDIIDIDVGSLDRLAREIAGYGVDALVLEPASLRQDVLARLTAQAEAR